MIVETYCCNCGTNRQLDEHGRCFSCGSGAIVHMPGETPAHIIPEDPKRGPRAIAASILGAAFVMFFIFGVWWYFSGMPKWVH